MTRRFFLRASLLASLSFCALSSAFAADLPYNDKADAKAEVAQALAEAGKSHSTVLLIFGANWCHDCRALDTALKSEKNAAMMAKSFKVVKVDVGNFDRNLDIANSYGNPLKKGIPAAVLVSPSNQVLFATKGGELANARKMSDSGVYDFFAKAAQEAGVK